MPDFINTLEFFEIGRFREAATAEWTSLFSRNVTEREKERRTLIIKQRRGLALKLSPRGSRCESSGRSIATRRFRVNSFHIAPRKRRNRWLAVFVFVCFVFTRFNGPRSSQTRPFRRFAAVFRENRTTIIPNVVANRPAFTVQIARPTRAALKRARNIISIRHNFRGKRQEGSPTALQSQLA